MANKIVKIIDGKKKCTRCFSFKLVSEFFNYKSLYCGYSPWCKTCHREYKNITPGYRKKHNSKYWKKWPEKNKARCKVKVAIRNGSLKKQECCICGNLNTQAHHDDYSKPLDVKWVCTQHHQVFHRK